MLEIEAVRKRYGGRPVLDGVDLHVAPGEVVGLLGPNGAGKTTLVSIVAGLRSADAGRVRVGGVDALTHPREARRLLGVAPQDLGVYPVLSARRNLTLFGELAGLRGGQLRSRVEEVAEALGLIELLDRRVGVLSGGQRRRLHTAMALLHEPAVLFLDEPTVGADVVTRTQVLDAVKALSAAGTAVVYCTHYLAEVEELGASVAVLHGGRIVARGSVDELVARHTTPAVELRFADGTVEAVPTPDPAGEAARRIAALGSRARYLVGVDLLRPSLERAYLAITGGEREEVVDAAA